MSLFSNISTPGSSMFGSTVTQNNSNKTQVESRFENRQAEFANEENFGEMVEQTMSNELLEGQDLRNRMIAQRRLKKKINCDTTVSLQTNLTISKELYKECEEMKVTQQDMNNIIQAFRTNEINQKYRGLVGIRLLLSDQNDSPIQELIDLGIVSDLLNLLDKSTPYEFQYEALWCLTNIATGTSDQANSIIIKGGIPKIVNCLDSNVVELKKQAVWTLGNIASDSGKSRDLLYREKVFEKILILLNSTTDKSLIKTCCWAISNFLKTTPTSPYEIAKKCISPVVSAIYRVPEEKEFLSDCCFILSFLTENYKQAAKEIINIGILPKLIEFFKLDIMFIQLTVLRIAGNLASGNANETDYLINCGILPYLKKTIFSPKKSIRKETAWIISNIAAGTPNQVETLIKDGFFPVLVEVIKKDCPEIQKEAIWAICNFTSVEKDDLMEMLIKQGILNIILEFLKLSEAKHLAVSIEALANLLKFGEKKKTNNINPVSEQIEKLGMCETLEKLQYHPVEIVYEKILKVLETYFETENVD